MRLFRKSSKDKTRSTFFAAPFAADGEGLGIGEWSVASLSEKWLDVCNELLERLGPTFSTTLQGPPAHLGLKVTSSDGAGLATFTVYGAVAVSSAYARGTSLDKEAEVLAQEELYPVLPNGSLARKIQLLPLSP
jgi:hypothetical protein